jgi:hypothetical protein
LTRIIRTYIFDAVEATLDFLGSGKASFTTGQIINVNGGETAA